VPLRTDFEKKGCGETEAGLQRDAGDTRQDPLGAKSSIDWSHGKC
jgi:hypothetical protein